MLALSLQSCSPDLVAKAHNIMVTILPVGHEPPHLVQHEEIASDMRAALESFTTEKFGDVWFTMASIASLNLQVLGVGSNLKIRMRCWKLGLAIAYEIGQANNPPGESSMLLGSPSLSSSKERKDVPDEFWELVADGRAALGQFVTSRSSSHDDREGKAKLQRLGTMEAIKRIDAIREKLQASLSSSGSGTSSSSTLIPVQILDASINAVGYKEVVSKHCDSA